MTKWKKPKWIGIYLPLIVNTGGNDIEELINKGEEVNVFNNAPLSLICVAVESQVALLQILKAKGYLKSEEEIMKKR